MHEYTWMPIALLLLMLGAMGIWVLCCEALDRWKGRRP